MKTIEKNTHHTLMRNLRDNMLKKIDRRNQAILLLSIAFVIVASIAVAERTGRNRIADGMKALKIRETYLTEYIKDGFTRQTAAEQQLRRVMLENELIQADSKEASDKVQELLATLAAYENSKKDAL